MSVKKKIIVQALMVCCLVVFPARIQGFDMNKYVVEKRDDRRRGRAGLKKNKRLLVLIGTTSIGIVGLLGVLIYHKQKQQALDAGETKQISSGFSASLLAFYMPVGRSYNSGVLKGFSSNSNKTDSPGSCKTLSPSLISEKSNGGEEEEKEREENHVIIESKNVVGSQPKNLRIDRTDTTSLQKIDYEKIWGFKIDPLYELKADSTVYVTLYAIANGGIHTSTLVKTISNMNHVDYFTLIREFFAREYFVKHPIYTIFFFRNWALTNNQRLLEATNVVSDMIKKKHEKTYLYHCTEYKENLLSIIDKGLTASPGDPPNSSKKPGAFVSLGHPEKLYGGYMIEFKYSVLFMGLYLTQFNDHTQFWLGLPYTVPINDKTVNAIYIRDYQFENDNQEIKGKLSQYESTKNIPVKNAQEINNQNVTSFVVPRTVACGSVHMVSKVKNRNLEEDERWGLDHNTDFMKITEKEVTFKYSPFYKHTNSKNQYNLSDDDSSESV